MRLRVRCDRGRRIARRRAATDLGVELVERARSSGCGAGSRCGERRNTAIPIGHLDDERQAAGERVDLVLLVELQQLFVLLLLVVLVLLLDLLDLGLDPLHLDHRPRLLRGQRELHQHDDEVSKMIAIAEVVERRCRRARAASRWRCRAGRADSSRAPLARRAPASRAAGPGRSRSPPNGWQRLSRRTREPRCRAPRRATRCASRAYSEHDGMYRHGDGRCAVNRW